MSRCLILTEDKILDLIHRYDGYNQPPLDKTEIELLLFALYNESAERGGIVSKAVDKEIIPKPKRKKK